MGGAGQLRERVTFARRPSPSSDEYGNPVTADFADQFTVAARVRYLVGGEAVQASRLEGRQPIVVSVRSSSLTRPVTADWRARNTRTGEIWNIRSVTPSENRAWIDFLCEAGVAT